MIYEFMVKLEKDVWQTQGQLKLSAYIRENFFEIQEPQRQRNAKQRALKPDGTLFLENGCTQRNHKIIIRTNYVNFGF